MGETLPLRLLGVRVVGCVGRVGAVQEAEVVGEVERGCVGGWVILGEETDHGGVVDDGRWVVVVDVGYDETC